MSKKRVYGPFFFEGGTVNGDAYLAMLQNWLMEKLHEEESADFIFQQDGAPPHFRYYLNTTLLIRWIGCSRQTNRVFLQWPPRSPDLNLCDSFLWGYVKGLVYILPLPRDLNDLKL